MTCIASCPLWPCVRDSARRRCGTQHSALSIQHSAPNTQRVSAHSSVKVNQRSTNDQPTDTPSAQASSKETLPLDRSPSNTNSPILHNHPLLHRIVTGLQISRSPDISTPSSPPSTSNPSPVSLHAPFPLPSRENKLLPPNPLQIWLTALARFRSRQISTAASRDFENIKPHPLPSKPGFFGNPSALAFNLHILCGVYTTTSSLWFSSLQTQWLAFKFQSMH